MATCNGIPLTTKVPHLEGQLETLAQAPKFLNFVQKLQDKDSNINCESLDVESINWFGPVKPERLGFVKVCAKAFDKSTGKPLNAIAFVRGGAVAVAIRVRVGTKKYLLVANQMRFPVGGPRTEAIAGMLDHETGNVAGVLVKEVEEETGLVIPNVSDLVNLGKIEPSMGGCDEEITLFGWETSVSQEQFQTMWNTVYGTESESIRLQFWLEDEHIWEKIENCMDPKLECAYGRFLRKH